MLLAYFAQMKCHWNKETKMFEAWQKGQHSEEQMVAPKRGLSAGVYKKVNVMASKHMNPADILKALKDDEEVEDHMMPSASQISSRKKNIKNDTSEDSFYRLQTFHDLQKYLESKILTSLEGYKALGILNWRHLFKHPKCFLRYVNYIIYMHS